MRKPTCCKCAKPIEVTREGKQGYCMACHAAYMRLTRPKHSELKPVAKLKSNARSYAHVYVNRGTLSLKACTECDSQQSEMHHEDYSKPLEVTWLCRKCHLRLHRERGSMVVSLTKSSDPNQLKQVLIK